MGILNLKKERLMKFTEDTDPIKDMGIGLYFWKLFPDAKCETRKGKTIYLVYGNVNLIDQNINVKEFCKFPKYIVDGNFWIDNNNLGTLKGCPIEVNGSFSCTGNPLENLEGLPKVIKGNVWIV